MQAIDILRDKLIGQFISRFSIGDTWDLAIGEYWLIAQEVVSKNEAPLNEWLQNNYSLFNSTVDKEQISKSAVIASLLRREITDIKLDDVYNLVIEFEEGAELIVLTNTNIVDWQWFLNRSGNDPYKEYLVAYFGEGEIAVSDNQN
jgi:hypothetical protein